MPLTYCPTGHTMPIRKIGGKDDVKRFLNSLGLVEGESVTVISELGGNMILNVKDTRIALDKTLAQRIMV
ncbi:ferrous iron transport protein A [Christensenellaceae bacterium OttesenSCG-928-K19]|nr:ferrous iron transport protein A [Christensenellaceae bacterium OttesenSCG-928-K19]